jgi:hypothetical protein
MPSLYFKFYLILKYLVFSYNSQVSLLKNTHLNFSIYLSSLFDFYDDSEGYSISGEFCYSPGNISRCIDKVIFFKLDCFHR